ncbi:MAG TPA: DUF4118 domain-containing protein [Thermoanaerobaculia bacterium]|nr:DUF4118 domain-containing protein [Thermoanaerobaculia bacterium]
MPVHDRLRTQWAAVPFAFAAVTFLSRAAGANALTAGFLLLAVVLGFATWGGWAIGAAASVVATLCLNFFFIPPTGTFTVEDPSNWVALGCFLGSSALVSRLVARARLEAAQALERQRELEVLYDLSFGLFTASQRSGALGEAAARTLGAIGAESGALFVSEGEAISSIGGEMEVSSELVERTRQGTGIFEDDSTTYIPLQVGGIMSGVLAARTPSATRSVLEQAARLLALAIERERLLRETAHLEAMRESDSLKTALLRAVSHDLRTPLTSMRLEIESLERRLEDQPEALAALRGLSVEQERLTRRIDNLLALARIEASAARPQPEPTPAGLLFRAARESLAFILRDRWVEVHIEPGCPDLWVDPSLALEVLVNLLENAARAAPPDESLELAVVQRDGRIQIDVRDRGPGVPADILPGGLGLQIARSLTEANGGSLKLLDRPGGGTIARLDLPAAPEPEEEKG